MVHMSAFPMSQWMSCKMARLELPWSYTDHDGGFLGEGAPARRVFGVSCSVGTIDQLQRATLMWENLALGRSSWVLSRKTYNCSKKCHLPQRGLGWLSSDGSKIVTLGRGTFEWKGIGKKRARREKGQTGIRSEPVKWWNLWTTCELKILLEME